MSQYNDITLATELSAFHFYNSNISIKNLNQFVINVKRQKKGRSTHGHRPEFADYCDP